MRYGRICYVAFIFIFAEKYNLKWGFVRDYDKNDSLYFCNTEYTEDMDNESWINIKNVL